MSDTEEATMPRKPHHTKELEGWVTKKEWMKYWYNSVIDNIERHGRSHTLMLLLEHAASDSSFIHGERPSVIWPELCDEIFKKNKEEYE